MKRPLPLIAIPGHTQVFPLGTPTPPRSNVSPLLRFSAKGLQLSSEGDDGLAIVGLGEGRRRLVQTLLSKHKFHPTPPSPGPFPYTSSIPNSPYPLIRHLTFSRPSPGGEFTDYTARYGALQDEDRGTLLDHYLSLYPEAENDHNNQNEMFLSEPHTSKERLLEIERIAAQIRVSHLLQTPLIGLSSGQTRRARLGAVLLSRARMVILEDPFAGLDVGSREDIAELLGKVNSGQGNHNGSELDVVEEQRRMRTILVLRGAGLVGMPKWINKVAQVTEDEVWTGSKEEYVERAREKEAGKVYRSASTVSGETIEREEGVSLGKNERSAEKEPVVRMKDVNVAYGSKKVLDDVSWSIYPGDKIHLQGSNGSGKTTILSLLLGHHPRSYAMPANNLLIFSKPRREIPMPYLRAWIGHTSPEIFASFPRNMRLTAGEAIGSGYEGVFSRREFTPEQVKRIKSLLQPFVGQLAAPARSGSGRQASHNRTDVDSIYDCEFSHFPASQQAVLLFLRSIVSRPRLLVLDEFSQTIDEHAWEVCKGVLEREWEEMRRDEGVEQAVVVVSHYESEVPWEAGEGKVFRLKDGRVDHSE